MGDDVDITAGVRVTAEEISELNGNPVLPSKVQRIALVAITADGQAQDIGTVTSPIPVSLSADNVLDLENVTITVDTASLEALELPLVTEITYFGGSDARTGLMHTYVEQRANGEERTVTITRDTSTGAITGQSATAWA